MPTPRSGLRPARRPQGPSKGWACLAWGLGLGAWPAVAQAHGDAQGLAAFFDGVVHALVAPELLAPLLLLALRLGLEDRPTVARSALAWALGTAAGLALGGLGGAPLPVAAGWGLSLALGLGIVLHRRPSPPRGLLASLGVGLWAGAWAGGGAAGEAGSLPAVAGTVVVAGLLPLDGALWIQLLRARWPGRLPRVALRVLASWISAAAMLMLALLLRSPASP